MSMGVAERRASTRALLAALGLVIAPGCGGRAQDDPTRATGAAGAEVGTGAAGGTPANGGAGFGGVSAAGAGAAAGSAFGGSGAETTPTPGLVDSTREEVEALRERACFDGDGSLYDEIVTMTRLFLLDASETMNRTADGFGQSDWDFARSAVIAAGDSAFDREATGLSFFPNRATMPHFGEALPSTECVDPSSDIEIAAGQPSNSEQWPAIVSALSTATPVPGAGGPLFDAYRSAVATLAAASSDFSRARVLALISSGQPTLGFGCLGADDVNAPLDPEPLIREIGEAANRGVATVVIGTPGSASTLAGTDARPWLSRAARAGGPTSLGCSDQGPNHCHFDLASRPELAQDLRRTLIRAGSAPLTCAYLFGAPPPGESLDVSFIYWTFDGQPKLVTHNREDSCGVGYRVIAEGPDPAVGTRSTLQFEVCPETCDVMRADGGRIEFLFGCSSGLPPLQ